MIKTIETDIGTYYFDSVNFTLSLSPISKQSSPTLDSVEDGVLKKVFLIVVIYLVRIVMQMVVTMVWIIVLWI